MPIFLTVFLAVYAAMNSYLFWKVHHAFPGMGRGHFVLAGGLALMVVGPILVRLADRAGYTRLAGAMGAAAYAWMPISFWFCCLAIGVDLWNVGVAAIAGRGGGPSALVVGPRAMLAAAGAIIAALTVWSILEANNIRLTTLTVRSDKLPPGSKPIRIAQISDMHLGMGASDGRLERALRLIEEARPDLIVNTGDFLDSPADHLKEYSSRLALVTAPLGKYSIAGNHEYYTGLGEAERFNQAAGFTFLRGQSVQVTEDLWIAGADDPGRGFADSPPLDPLPVPAPGAMPLRVLAEGSRRDPPAETACEHGTQGRRPFVLLLKHRPTVQADSLGRFDLQLSGHTHGGQIFPFTLVIAATERYDRGWFQLAKGSAMYVSRGTGTWGPPMRLLSPPEVTLITIEPAEPEK